MSCGETMNGDHRTGKSTVERDADHVEEDSRGSAHYKFGIQMQMLRALPGQDLWGRDTRIRSLILGDQWVSITRHEYQDRLVANNV